MSDFERVLRERLAALEAGVPPARERLGLEPRRAPAGRHSRSALPMGLGAALVLVVASAAIAGVTLRLGSSTAATSSPSGSAEPSSSPSGANIVYGADGIPTSIHGERIYTFDAFDARTYLALPGSFLLRVTDQSLPGAMPTCPPQLNPPSPQPAEADLLARGFCGRWPAVGIAPKGAALMADWPDHTVVVRAHAHDPEAAACRAEYRAQCDEAVVPESLVWPTKPAMPAEIGGQTVLTTPTYAEQAGSFLVGGIVTDLAHPFTSCSESSDAAYLKLEGVCDRALYIGRFPIAPMSAIAGMDGTFVVAQVHTNDPLARQCPADARASCENAIVVDAILWSANPYAR